MEVFEKNGKVNFIDENDVFVGYDLSQCCCEDAGKYYEVSIKFNELAGDYFDLREKQL